MQSVPFMAVEDEPRIEEIIKGRKTNVNFQTILCVN